MVSGKGKNRTTGQKAPPSAPVPRSSSPSDYVNNDVNSIMHYPPASTHVDKIQLSQGEDWNLPTKMNDRKALLKKVTEPKWPLREAFSKDNGQGKILTNHFTYTLTADKLYEYKILDLPKNVSRQLKKHNFNMAVEACTFLQEAGGCFATDDIDTIVSWKPIHKQISSNFNLSVEKEDDFLDIWSGCEIFIRGKSTPIRFALVKELRIQDLANYSVAHPDFEHVNFIDICRCLNLLVSNSLTTDVYKQSANKFFVKTARNRLGQCVSLETIRGYFYNVKPGMGNVIINFNLATSAFFRPILVSDFLNDRNTFVVEHAAQILMKLRVCREHDPQTESKKEPSYKEFRRTWLICELSDVPIGELTFQPDESKPDGQALKLSVVQYLSSKHRKPFDSSLPAVNVGKKERPRWYPQEFLRIVPYQIYTDEVPHHLTAHMVNEACRDPAQSRNLIETEGLRSLGFVSGRDSSSFMLRNEVPVRFNATMLRIPYQNIGFPLVHYQITKAMLASRWKIPQNAKFLKTPHTGPLIYAPLGSPGVDSTSPSFYTNLLKAHVARCGISPAQMRNITPGNGKALLKLEDLKAAMQKLKASGAKLVILVLPKSDREWYKHFKSLADRIVGIQSICFVEKLTGNPNFFDQYMQNVAMKINLKFGGINHTALQPQEYREGVMVLGADLIHAATGSIAAVVGSIDPILAKYLGSVRLQPIQDSNGPVSDREIIYTLEGMVLERLLHWNHFHPAKLPDKIFYYRDGVSSGHYSKINEIELKSIHNAYGTARKMLKLTPKNLELTAVIVTKRHHTRFYVPPGQPGDRWGNGNTLPGTCVDKLVTSPYYQDFFLQSHIGIKGTAKPTHYFVIENGIAGLNLEKLRDLTNKLCYSYCRATTGVSYAAPTYYADRLCERAAVYMKHITNDRTICWSRNRARNQNGTFAFDAGADAWFQNLERKFYPHKDKTGVPVWSKYAPWCSDVANTMFWM